MSFEKRLARIIIFRFSFSVGSIVTAVKIEDELWIMYIVVIVTVFIMLEAEKPVCKFISKHPSFKFLTLCFLMMIGVPLITEGFQFEILMGTFSLDNFRLFSR